VLADTRVDIYASYRANSWIPDGITLLQLPQAA